MTDMTYVADWLDDNGLWLAGVGGLVVLHLAAFAFGVWLERRTLRRTRAKWRWRSHES